MANNDCNSTTSESIRSLLEQEYKELYEKEMELLTLLRRLELDEIALARAPTPLLLVDEPPSWREEHDTIRQETTRRINQRLLQADSSHLSIMGAADTSESSLGACLLSMIVSTALAVVGALCVFSPQTVLKVIIDENDDNMQDGIILCQMAGGVLFAQSLHFWILVFAFGNKTAVIRISIGIQSIIGLSWLVAGLIHEENSLGLAVFGFVICILACFALMLSFWPSDIILADSSTSQTIQNPNVNTQPLLDD